MESTLKSNAEARLQEHKDEALRQRTDFEAQVGQLQQTIEELKTEVERARLAAHERVRKEALAENAAQVSALEARIADAEEKHQLAESSWTAKQTALEEEFRVKSSQADDEYQRLQEEYNTSKERTAQITEELDQVRHLLAESNVRIDGLAEQLKKETNRANETAESLKQVKKTLQASEARLEDTETEKENLAKEYAAKAADLESAYKIDQTLRQELETSLTDMGQSLAQRESELIEAKQVVERLNARIDSLETENRTVVEAGARLRNRFDKLKTLLLDDETEVPGVRVVDLIAKKRNGGTLTDREITVDRPILTDKLPDYQMAAMAMAIYYQGLNSEELSAWTKAMLHSGRVLDFSHIPKVKVDKHSTGG